MSQVYEDLNVTYQREKRSREKLDEENKKYQAMMKQSEEEKFQYLTLNENLKKDLFFSQESSRLNEVCLVS
jgi:predicted nuclease with TOPRIM domain